MGSEIMNSKGIIHMHTRKYNEGIQSQAVQISVKNGQYKNTKASLPLYNKRTRKWEALIGT
jgi:hypothetical protein